MTATGTRNRTMEPAVGGDDEGRIVISIRRRLRSFHLNVHLATDSRRIVLFGPSGSGKTLTLKAVAGILRPDQGRICVAGRTLYNSARRIHVPPNNRRAGYVPQGYALFPHLTVAGNVSYGLGGMPLDEHKARVRRTLELTGLSGFANANPRDLSGGQQQRVALARALAVDPMMLLLDEPFSAVDMPVRAGLRADLAGLLSRTDTAMLMVTHDLTDAFALGDWIVVMESGSVLQEGSKDDVYYRPATRKVAELVDIRNFLQTTVLGVDAKGMWLDWKGRRLLARWPVQALSAGDQTEVCIRPTQLMIRRPDDGNFSQRANVIAGRIVDEAIIGETYRLQVRVQGSPSWSDLEIDLLGYTYFRLGLDHTKDIEMSVKPEHLHVLPPHPQAHDCHAE